MQKTIVLFLLCLFGANAACDSLALVFESTLLWFDSDSMTNGSDYVRVYHDKLNQKLRYDYNLENQPITFIWDGRLQKSYTINPTLNTCCSDSNQQVPWPYDGVFSVLSQRGTGKFGAQQVNYMTGRDTDGETMDVFLMISDVECIPIQWIWNYNEVETQSMLGTDSVSSITDPNVFNPLSVCNPCQKKRSIETNLFNLFKSK
eukprot:TRINITY_DN3381_c0_g1_i1.p1 TRINITY_DN3381_c0_g1~~TRINITY_DN3381_c0_g1_i1.p1  ORF type:complete len:203 (+),score=41.41 TRINITY_DN3381_c0_g1_i1:44-652(+)